MYHPDLIRHPDGCPALVLNADYTPLSYYPLSVWPWQTAIKAVFLDRVDIVSHYEREVRSPTAAIKLPSVIALKQYVKPSQFPANSPISVDGPSATTSPIDTRSPTLTNGLWLIHVF